MRYLFANKWKGVGVARETPTSPAYVQPRRVVAMCVGKAKRCLNGMGEAGSVSTIYRCTWYLDLFKSQVLLLSPFSRN
jgi:hypothetical protein